MKKAAKDPNRYPRGWTAARVRRVIDHYDNQSEAEAAAEDDAAFRNQQTVMTVPVKLVPTVRRLIARHHRGRR